MRESFFYQHIHLLFLSIPVFLYFHTTLFWHYHDRTPLGGDEPHYLILADSLISDFSLDVKKSYDRDAIQKKIFGPVDYHTRTNENGVFSGHSLGLSAIVAIPLKYFGIIGVRLFLAMFTLAIPLTFFFIGRSYGISKIASSFIALAASIGLPFQAAAGQVYPDLVAGVLILVIIAILLNDQKKQRTSMSYALHVILLSLLPWLHIKYIASALLLLLMSLRTLSKQEKSKVTLKTICFTVTILASIGLLFLYNHYAFGKIGGFYSSSDVIWKPSHVIMVLVGLHLDQTQGVFFQQPLFLLGVTGLFAFFRKDWVLASFLSLIYLSIVIPNSSHSCWYGCASMSGRFMWSVISLWYIPFIYFYSVSIKRNQIIIILCGLVAIFWQAILYTSWKPNPGKLYLHMLSDFNLRNSFFSPEWTSRLPSFYDFEGYLRHIPNYVAFSILMIFFMAGFFGQTVCLDKKQIDKFL